MATKRRHPAIGTRLDPAQIINLINSSDGIDPSADPESLYFKFEPSPDKISCTKSLIFFIDGKVSAAQREILISVYSFLGSRLTTVPDIISKLHMVIFAVFYNLNENHSFKTWLIENNYQFHKVTANNLINSLGEFIKKHDLGDEYKDLIESLKGGTVSKASAIYAPYSCLLGKRLNVANATGWGAKCVEAMLGSVGVIDVTSILRTIYPTYKFASDFNANITQLMPLRTMGLRTMLNWVSNKAQPEWLNGLTNAILTRLAWTELTGFRLIVTFLIKGQPYIWLWGYIAVTCPEVLQALNRFLQYQEQGPYLKLITRSADNKEFNNFTIKRVAEIARLVGMILGQTTLKNVKTGFKFENEELVMAGLRAIMSAGDTGMYNWANYASEQILPKEDNPEFYKIIREISILGQASISNNDEEKRDIGDGV